MHVINKGGSTLHGRLNVVVIAAIFIIAGLLFVGRNLGMVDYGLFRIFVSWQMLLIVLGLVSLTKRQSSGGLILIGIGSFFLIPRIIGVGPEWLSVYWPLVFVLIGILLLFKLFRPGRPQFCRERFSQETSYKTDKGFVNSVNTFGSVKQIVLDPVFKGAKISNTFGGTILDLRHTVLEAEQTFIDLDCTFGGVEIFVPGNWNIDLDVQHMAGGSDDKRFRSRENIDNEHKLIIRGNITFGGLEIKS